MQPIVPAPSRRRAPVRFAAALMLCAGLLAGCGSGDAGDASSASPLPVPSSVVVPSEAVVPESDGGPGKAEEPATEPTEEPSEEPSKEPEVEPAACTALQDAWTGTNQALLSLSENHPRAFVNSFRVAANSMADIEVDVPETIADDWQTMSAYLARVNRAFEEVDANDADAVGTAFAAAVSQEDTQDATAAAGRITDFLAAECAAP